MICCPIFMHADNFKIPENKISILKDLQKQKIQMADEIFVVNKNGYIGKSTKEEIQYATSIGKVVRYMESMKDECEI